MNEQIRQINKTIGLLNSMIKSGERHTSDSTIMVEKAFKATQTLEESLKNQKNDKIMPSLNKNLDPPAIYEWCENLEKRIKKLENLKPSDIDIPDELEPVLAEIEHTNDSGLSNWHEVVYFDGGWQSYSTSDTFEDGERVVNWKYCKNII